MSTNEDMKRVDLVYLLKKQGWDVKKLSLAWGMGSTTLYNSLSNRCPKGDCIIAHTLNMGLREIWPQRYTTEEEAQIWEKHFNPDLKVA